MRFRQVEAFRAVIEGGGITAAAALLHLSQPSVSRLVADLEASVGFTLFERRGRRLVPSPQALALYETVRRSFTGLELLDQAARRIRAHPVGTIRIAALPALAAALLPPALTVFWQEYPDIEVTVESLGQRQVEDRVFLAQADLGLGVQTPLREGVREAPLARAPYVCVLSSGHSLAAQRVLRLRDLADQNLIGPMHEADALWYGIDEALAAEGISVRRRLETQQSWPAYAFVRAGFGVAIAEPFSAPLFSQLGVVARRLEPELAVSFVLMEPDIGSTPAVTRLLSEAIQRAAAACLSEVARLTEL